MVLGIISSDRHCIGIFTQYAKRPRDKVCELVYSPQGGFDSRLSYYKTNHNSTTAYDSTASNLIITYLNNNLSYTAGTDSFTPDDTNIGELIPSCDFLAWQNDIREPLKIMKDSSNLGTLISTQWDAFIQAHYS